MMKKVLISIKPKFVERIKAGDKKFEYRKKVFNASEIDEMYIYSSYPVKRVVGRCKVSRIIGDTPEELWKQTKEASGITKEYFDSYFDGRDKAYAIEMVDIEFFAEPKELSELDIVYAPQSYMFIPTSL